MAHLTSQQILVVKGRINWISYHVYSLNKQMLQGDARAQEREDTIQDRIDQTYIKEQRDLDGWNKNRDLPDWYPRGVPTGDIPKDVWESQYQLPGAIPVYWNEMREKYNKQKGIIWNQWLFYRKFYENGITIYTTKTIPQLENLLTNHESEFPAHFSERISQPPEPYRYWSDFWEHTASLTPPFTPPYPEVEWDAPVTSPDTSKRGRCFRPWPCGKGYTRIWCIPCSES